MYMSTTVVVGNKMKRRNGEGELCTDTHTHTHTHKSIQKQTSRRIIHPSVAFPKVRMKNGKTGTEKDVSTRNSTK